MTDFFAWQADIVKKYKRDDQFITHNFDFEWHDYSYGMQPEVNQYEAAKCMDIAGCDIYHPSREQSERPRDYRLRQYCKGHKM